MKSQAQLHAESKCATKVVITIFQNEEVNKRWQRKKFNTKVLTNDKNENPSSDGHWGKKDPCQIFPRSDV